MAGFKESLDAVARLVKSFRLNLSAYRSTTYKEAHLRQEFLDPLFIVLGWDVQNIGRLAPSYREVVVEDSVEVGGQRKAPDYVFRVGRDRKFFAEAKKPDGNLKGDAIAAYQLKSYAWSSKLNISLLLSFEEFSVYDCRKRPFLNDKASVGRVNHLHFEEYPERWKEIWDVFSREAVWTGAFDQFAESDEAKRGTSEVDAEFLKDIERWREQLAHNIALRNSKLLVDDLSDAVQRTIDRIIFFRMAEDRGIEKYEQLKRIAEQEHIYANLIHLFRQADLKYNSGIFDFSVATGDRVTPTLSLDDKVLKPILSELYFPESPYRFNMIPVEILGSVYEQFLGKVIRLTAGHQGKVEEKPEVRKAGGVYYTPVHIVDFIVEKAIGPLIKGKTPQQLRKFRVLDAACGSGSFLVGAYQYLLDHYLNWYLSNNPKSHLKSVREDKDGWRLTFAQKRKVLTNSIFGVDKDRQATEVTKLSLLLKLLEVESESTIGQHSFFERALPNLDSNITCGNSLVAPDYLSQRLIPPDEEELRNINVFEWIHAFPGIFREGGFDCVIGNPPYLFITELSEEEKKYFFRAYGTAEYRFDVYGLFIELAVTKLLKEGGSLGFIVPHTILSNISFRALRELVLSNTYLQEVIDIGPGVFRGAKNETMILILRTGKVGRAKTHVVLTTAKTFPNPEKEFVIPQKVWAKSSDGSWLTRVSPAEQAVVASLEEGCIPLGNLCTINQGLRTGDNQMHLADRPKGAKWKPAAGGEGVGRYEPLAAGLYVNYDPAILDAPRKREIFEGPEKLVVQEVRNITLPRRIVATYDDKQFYCLQSTNVINLKAGAEEQYDIKYLLAVLNSAAANFYFRQRFPGNNHIASYQLAQIPMPPASSSAQERIATLVEKLLELRKRLSTTANQSARSAYEREAERVDEIIDEAVFRMYGVKKAGGTSMVLPSERKT